MKGAFLLSESQSLFSDACAALVRRGATYAEGDGGVAQYRDAEGRLFTLFGTVDPEFDWEFREGPFSLAGQAVMPDMSTVTACSVECRWEELFAVVVKAIASELTTPAWVLDGDGVLWLASEVDPKRIRL